LPATVRSALKAARAALDASGSREPDLEAEVLVGEALGWTRARLFTHLDDDAPQPVLDALQQMVQRRETGEPLAYIVGWREFYGRPFRVTKDVLIPRPETESIVEAALDVASPWPSARVVEVGTGSGAIAVSLALALPRAAVTATDISRRAIDVAVVNARTLGPDVNFVQTDLLGGLRGPFDLVVANLPYVPESERPHLQREIRDWEPEIAVFAGTDGLCLLRRLIGQLAVVLTPGGAAVLECMSRQVGEVLEIGRRSGLAGDPVLQGELPVGAVLQRGR
jgi:release factor glutamine methyltransferase